MKRPVAALAVTLLAGLLEVGARAGATGDPLRYSLKSQDSTFATAQTERVVEAQIPLDKTYADLTDLQKRLVRGLYVQLGNNDEPPFPKDGLGSIYRAVEKGVDKHFKAGPLSVIVDIDAEGVPTQAAVYKTPDAALGDYVAGVLMNQSYKPGLCDGIPCAMQFPFRMVFRAPGKWIHSTY